MGKKKEVLEHSVIFICDSHIYNRHEQVIISVLVSE